MSAISDFIAMPGATNSVGMSYGYQVPQYRLDQTMPAINENEAIAQNRISYDFKNRTLPMMANQGAAMGQTGSSGLAKRAQFAGLDASRQYLDVARAAALQRASIQTQNALQTFGGMIT